MPIALSMAAALALQAESHAANTMKKHHDYAAPLTTIADSAKYIVAMTCSIHCHDLDYKKRVTTLALPYAHIGGLLK